MLYGHPPLESCSMWTAALLLASTASAGSLKDLDKRNGFRDLVLGTPCAQVPGFVTNGVPGRKLVSYSRSSDVLQVGEAQLQSIAYTCYLDQLSQVRIALIGEDNQQAMLDALVEAYGPASTEDNDGKVRTWSSKKVLLESFTAPSSDALIVTMSSQALLQQRLQDVIDAKAAAVEDL